MDNELIENQYYKLETMALNEPLQFLDPLRKPKPKSVSSPLILTLNTVCAYLVNSKLLKAAEAFENLGDMCDKSQNPFFLCKYHLLKYKYYLLSHHTKTEACQELEKAEQYQKKCRSLVLESEILLAHCIRNIPDRELTESEDAFHEAMKVAVQAGYTESVYDVHLGYIQLYLMNNLPQQASEELQVIKDMINPMEHPYKYVMLKNLEGVVNVHLKLYQEALRCYEDASLVAEEKGYILQLAQIYTNKGIVHVNTQNYDESIKMHDKGLALISDSGGVRLSIKDLLITNKSRALSIGGHLLESIELMKETIQDAIQTGNEKSLNILKVNLSDALIETGDYDTALQYIEDAMQYFSENKLYDMLQSAILCKARLYEVKEDYQTAFECMEKLYSVSRMYFQENFSKRTNRYKQRIDDLRNEYMVLKSRFQSTGRSTDGGGRFEMIGEDPLIKKAISNALRASRYPYVNVHIYGETGTGKEIIARMIHDAGNLDKPMVAINSSAITSSLVESELFGHSKGAFTGAISDHKGKFLLANKGTLFLDEISEMSLACQAKLLRAIEQNMIVPVGSQKEIPVTCRIISASNRKLTDLIRTNKFRLDLYHRLNKVEIYLPPLRDRGSDLDLLVMHFVKRFATEFHSPVPVLEDSFFLRLKEYSFPGNVRELMNIIERIFILNPKPNWTSEQLDGLIEETDPLPKTEMPIRHNLNQKEAQFILDTLKKVNWRQKEAALILGMTESTLSRRIKKYNLEK